MTTIYGPNPIERMQEASDAGERLARELFPEKFNEPKMTRTSERQEATDALMRAQDDMVEKRLAAMRAEDVWAHRATTAAEDDRDAARGAYDQSLANLQHAVDRWAAAQKEKPCHIRLSPSDPILCGAEPDGTSLEPSAKVDPASLCRKCWPLLTEALDAQGFRRDQKASQAVAMMWEVIAEDSKDMGHLHDILGGLQRIIVWPAEVGHDLDFGEMVQWLGDKIARRKDIPAVLKHARAAAAATTEEEMEKHWLAADAAFKVTTP